MPQSVTVLVKRPDGRPVRVWIPVLPVVLVFAPPDVRFPVPIEMLPAPAMEPTVSLKLLRSKVAPVETLTDPTGRIAFLPG